MNKKQKVITILGIASLVASFSQIILLIEFVYDDLIKGLLWGIAIECLILSIILFICNQNKGRARVSKYLYLSIGSILLIICAFSFIENWLLALRLVSTIAFAVFGLIGSCHALLNSNTNRDYNKHGKGDDIGQGNGEIDSKNDKNKI